jgi:hypothetical protein
MSGNVKAVCGQARQPVLVPRPIPEGSTDQAKD